MQISAKTKYYVLIVLAGVISALTYVENAPALTEGTIVTAVLIGAVAIVHDLEPNTSTSTA